MLGFYYLGAFNAGRWVSPLPILSVAQLKEVHWPVKGVSGLSAAQLTINSLESACKQKCRKTW